MHHRSLIVSLALMLLFAVPVQAEQYRDFGDYRVHYSAFKSDILAPEVAKAHNLSRSHYRAIINITVQKRASDGTYAPVSATVTGSARDIYSKLINLNMMEIREGSVVYYLAEFPVTDEQKLTFDIEVTPQGGKQANSLRFERQFFVN